MWSLRFSSRALAAVAGALLVQACSSPQRPEEAAAPVPPVTQPGAPAPTANPATAPASTPGNPSTSASASTPGAPTPPPRPPPPERAVADFGRAVAMMRAGKSTDAELELQQVAVAYPQYAAPDINLGILYRKTDRLELSEKALRAAVEREPANALAWTELGVTLRLRGQFKDAADAYHQAIAADADFAPAYRNLGVLLDLYMGDPAEALSAFERYKALSGEEKPVSSWIAELRQRVGKPPAAPTPAAPAAQPAAPAAEPAAPSANPAADSPTPAKEPAATPDRAGG